MSNPLQKCVCKDCMGTTFLKVFPWRGDHGPLKVFPWKRKDKEHWKTGHVYCPKSPNVRTFEEAYRDCPHRPAHDGCMLIWDEKSK